MSGGGGFDSLLAFNIDLQDCKIEILRQVCQSNHNVYATFYNSFENKRGAFLFKLCEEVNLEKFMIEYAYKNYFIDRQVRNAMHSCLHNFTKTQFFEDRRLYNLSSNWNLIGADSKSVESLQLQYPKTIVIGLLNQCNVNCPSCPWFGLKHQKTQTTDYFYTKKQLSSDKVYEILDFASKGKSRVVFSGPGEPLLDSNLLNYVQYAKKNGIRHIALATNGTMLTLKTFKELLNGGIDFFEMMVSFSKDIYVNCDRDCIIKYQSALYDIAYFLDSLDCNAKIKLAILYEKESLKEALKFFLSMQQFSRLECQIAYHDASESGWVGETCNQRHTCSAPFANLYVFPDGSCGVCDMQRAWLGRKQVESFCIGNVYQENLEQIWQGKLHWQMQQKHLNLSFDKICEICGSWWNEES